MALDDGAVGPVEAQRIDQHDDAGEAEQRRRRRRASRPVSPTSSDSGTIHSMVV